MGYFIKTKSGPKGPFAETQLRRLVDEGRLPENHTVFDEEGRGISVGTVLLGSDLASETAHETPPPPPTDAQEMAAEAEAMSDRAEEMTAQAQEMSEKARAMKAHSMEMAADWAQEAKGSRDQAVEESAEEEEFDPPTPPSRRSAPRRAPRRGAAPGRDSSRRPAPQRDGAKTHRRTARSRSERAEEIEVEALAPPPSEPITWRQALLSRQGLFLVGGPIFLVIILFAAQSDSERGVRSSGRHSGKANVARAIASKLGTGGILALGFVLIPAGAGLFYLLNRNKVE